MRAQDVITEGVKTIAPAYRVLMVWVYDRTGSLLVAMLMHGSLTATQLILMPRPASGMPLLTSILAWAAALWIVVAVLGRSNVSHTLRDPCTRGTLLVADSTLDGPLGHHSV